MDERKRQRREYYLIAHAGLTSDPAGTGGEPFLALPATRLIYRSVHRRSANHSLVALERTSGAIRWLFVEPPGKEVVEKKAEWGFAASPLIVDGVVYAVDLNGRVYAFDAAFAGAG